MAIITLTTDFGERDHFVGAIKGFILSEIDNATIVDISHLVSPFNIMEAAYILKNAYKTFPKGSIHIIGVDSELTPINKHMAVLIDGHYFIGADNGILSFLASEINPEKMVEINIHDRIESVFPVLDVFVKVAGHISRGGTLEVIGKSITKLKMLKDLSPIINNEETQITGSVIYVDNYGNVITNIPMQLFERYKRGRNFELWARNHKFTEIYRKYSEAVNFDKENPNNKDGEKLAIFNSANLIELAIYRSNLDTVGGASTLLGLKYRDTVTVNFT
ncbi:SAM hydrolase/SAM-dependent halogenase family protein [Galbibacter pacificus]|uniref:SAM-dependent chlorinase/fluorinase n=1 Tax=Galbibacter pacificus TaxID=2996052 RepID=A0ABT6FR15_9FLAO|nr:SAM-dependent chlorinase/fluorinase [Galbibacter pacificus]MDG3581856.1 SAM-dependent chlorinase/fluorinase [Galbibacter pacificus]MDG3585670.1 SAM-dependent chlorinase/fluorinase [Galbibacter pacificus]